VTLAAGTFDPTQTLIGGAGVAGVWVLTFITAQIYSAKTVEHERTEHTTTLARITATMEAERLRVEAEAARRQAMIDTLLAVYHNEILPVLGDYEKKLAPALAHVEDVLKKMEWIINEYEQRGRRRGLLAEEEERTGRRREDPFPPYRNSGRDSDYGDRGRLSEGPGPVNDPPPQGGTQ
jgi:hypothetical protein